MTICDGPSFNKGMHNLETLAVPTLQVEVRIVMGLYPIDR